MRWILIVMIAASVAIAGTVKVGDIGYLNNGAKVVLGAVSEEAFDALIKAANAGDTEGYYLMVLQGRVLVIDAGTKVRVLDSSWGAKQVRILEGEYYGVAVWVAMEHVKSSK